MPKWESRGTMYATGNNISLVGDMTRRGLLCNLDPKVERPELRSFNFDPIARVLPSRGDYLAAALTISRAYRVAGSPEVCGPIGSYGPWSDAVRAPLIWLGEDDPVESMEAARDEDPKRAELAAVLAGWKVNLDLRTPYAVRDLIDFVSSSAVAITKTNGKFRFDTGGTDAVPSRRHSSTLPAWATAS